MLHFDLAAARGLAAITAVATVAEEATTLAESASGPAAGPAAIAVPAASISATAEVTRVLADAGPDGRAAELGCRRGVGDEGSSERERLERRHPGSRDRGAQREQRAALPPSEVRGHLDGCVDPELVPPPLPEEGGQRPKEAQVDAGLREPLPNIHRIDARSDHGRAQPLSPRIRSSNRNLTLGGGEHFGDIFKLDSGS